MQRGSRALVVPSPTRTSWTARHNLSLVIRPPQLSCSKCWFEPPLQAYTSTLGPVLWFQNDTLKVLREKWIPDHLLMYLTLYVILTSKVPNVEAFPIVAVRNCAICLNDPLLVLACTSTSAMVIGVEHHRRPIVVRTVKVVQHHSWELQFHGQRKRQAKVRITSGE